MKVNIGLELSENQRRQIRAGMKRGGAATRKEARIFVQHVVNDALRRLPEAKPKRMAKAKPVPVVTPDADVTCQNCGQPFVAHAGMMQSCPGSRSRRPGVTRWKEVA